MSIWMTGESSMKHHYLKKEIFVVTSTLENIIDADYTRTKRVCKDFEIINFREYHNLYVQSNTLLLADVFENFRNMLLEIYELDLAKFFQVLD